MSDVAKRVGICGRKVDGPDRRPRFRPASAGCGRGHSVRLSFDNLDHGHLRKFLQLRVRDGVLLRLIGKWLNVGVMEGGSVSYPDAGSPQGGVISPLLSNVFLHYVLDLWFVREVRPHLRHALPVRLRW